MSDHIAAVDAGNGGTTSVLAKVKGGYKYHYEPSVRAAATGDSLGLGSDWELEYTYVDWYGHRYVVGDDVIRVTRRHLERHMGANRYGDEFHQFLVATSLAQLGVKKGTVDLTLFAPPGMYREAKQLIQERFSEANGEVQIKLKGDSKPRCWHYDNITVYPEGIGAAACFVLDDQGQIAEGDALTGETLILDAGVYTLDVLKLLDGNFNPETLEHATWDNGGVDTHIRQPIVRWLKRQSDDFANLSVDDIDLAIRHGAASDDYTLRIAGYEIDLAPMIEKYRERYAGWVANNIIDGAFDGLRGIRSVILVGGGALLMEEHLKTWYGDKIANRKKHSGVKRIHPVDMNAVGGLRLALMRVNQEK